jgi:hypothetical protein
MSCTRTKVAHTHNNLMDIHLFLQFRFIYYALTAMLYIGVMNQITARGTLHHRGCF